MKVVKSKIKLLYKWVFARASFYKLNKLMYSLSLYGMGILNYENDRISGEYSFLNRLTKFLDKDSIVLDVGANVGRYSNLVKELNPDVKIYAFEPHPKTFKILEKSAQLNDYFAFQVGCGREKTQLKLYDYREQDGSSHASLHKNVIQEIHNSNLVEHLVDIINLDSFVAEKEITKVDLLKIDVEGNEYAVLEGFQQSVEKGIVEIIHWEFNSMNVVSRTFFKDFYKFLDDYHIFRMLPYSLIPLNEYNSVMSEIYAFQNIVAIHKNSKFHF